MQFINSGAICVDGFKLRREQRNEIELAIGNDDYLAANRAQLDAFWASLENDITLYQELKKEVRTPLKDHKARYQAINQAAKDLHKELECLPTDAAEALNAQTLADLYFRSERFGLSGFASLKALEPLLMGSLNLLMESTRFLIDGIDGNIPTSKDRGLEKVLVSRLIQSYQDVFGKLPPNNMEHWFYKLLNEWVAQTIKRQIGYEVFKAELEKRSASVGFD